MASEYTQARARKGCVKRLMRPARAVYPNLTLPTFMKEWRLGSKQYDFLERKAWRASRRRMGKMKRKVLRKVNLFGLRALNDDEYYHYYYQCESHSSRRGRTKQQHHHS